jgi:hypothetical protein
MNQKFVKIMEGSKGSAFKQKYGYSKSKRRLMIKYGIDRNNTRNALEQLKELKKQRKRKAAGIRKNKHLLSLEHMRTKGKVRLKGKKKKSETKTKTL